MLRRPGRAGPGGDRHPVRRLARLDLVGIVSRRRAPTSRRGCCRPPCRRPERTDRRSPRRRGTERARGAPPRSAIVRRPVAPAGRRAGPGAAARRPAEPACSVLVVAIGLAAGGAPASPPASLPACSRPALDHPVGCSRCASGSPASSPACWRPTCERTVLLPVVVVAVATARGLPHLPRRDGALGQPRRRRRRRPRHVAYDVVLTPFVVPLVAAVTGASPRRGGL